MPVLSAVDATVFEVHGSRFSSFVSPARGSDQLCAWMLEIPPTTAGVPHAPSRDEVLVVLSGSLHVTMDGHEDDVGCGDVLFVPAGTQFQVDAGPDGATAWVTTTPGLEAVMADGTTFSPPWAR